MRDFKTEFMPKDLTSASTSDLASELPILRFVRNIGPLARNCRGKSDEMRGPGIYCSIMILNSVIERSGNRKLEELGLTLPQWLALGAVLHCGDAGISHGQLSQRMMLSKAPVTGLVDRLARAGLVERKPDENDRRVSRVVITAPGEAMWHRAHDTLEAQSEDDMLNSISAEQQDQLLRLLSHLLSSFAAQDPHVAELVEDARGEGDSS